MRVYTAVWGLFAAFLILPPPSMAQTFGTSQSASEQNIHKELLSGTWVLESVKLIGSDGRIEEPYGAKPKGILILEADGRCAFIVANPDTPRPKYSYISTPEEAMAIAKGSWSFFGHYVADERPMITFSIEAGSSPDLNGYYAYFDAKKITENELTISRIPPPGGHDQTDFAYRRAPGAAFAPAR
jgi:hypothetical protein